jgi:acetyl esterase/lipase
MPFDYIHAVKNIFLSLSIALLLFSCKKDDAAPDIQNLSEENKLNIFYGSDPLQKMDVYLPAGRKTDSTRVIVMVHGGAWSEGTKEDFNPYVTILKQRLPDYAIFNIDYRLATASSNSFPAQENDMKSVINFILQKKNEYHISDKMVLLGASSGGHMAMLQAYKNSSPKIKAVVDYFGPTDMVALYNQASLTVQFGLQILLGGTPTTNSTMYQQSSPINYVDANDPPTIIFHGLSDNIVNPSHSTVLQQKLQSLGISNELYSYPGVGHEIWPSAIMDDTFDKAEAFITAHVH